MKKIYIVRHAESKAQTGEESGFDTNLSANGIKQAKKLRKILPQIEFDTVYLSPLKRARQTFEYSGAARENVVFDSRLVEVLPDAMYSEILPYKFDAGYGKRDRQNAWLLDPVKRMRSFINSLYRTKNGNVLVVAHAMALSNMLNIFLSDTSEPPVETFKYCFLNNAALSLLEIYHAGDPVGRDRVKFWNYNGHFGDKDFVLK